MGGSGTSSEDDSDDNRYNNDIGAAGEQAMPDFILDDEAGNQGSGSDDESSGTLHSQFRKQMRRMVPRLLSDDARSAKEEEADNFGLESITQGKVKKIDQPQ